MGLISGLKSIITGSKKSLEIAEKTTDGLIAGFDKMVFTQEEKFDAWKEVAKAHLEVMKLSANESSSKSMTRRFLTLILVGDYCFLTTVACFLWRWNKEWAGFILQVCNKTPLGQMTLWCVIFYVGYYGVSNIIGSIKK